MLACEFCLSQVLFHKVFNSSVENFHKAFIIIRASCERVAHELLRRVRTRNRVVS
jgi:hypothetical protein